VLLYLQSGQRYQLSNGSASFNISGSLSLLTTELSPAIVTVQNEHFGVDFGGALSLVNLWWVGK
jgi:hypothetical protein